MAWDGAAGTFERLSTRIVALSTVHALSSSHALSIRRNGADVCGKIAVRVVKPGHKVKHFGSPKFSLSERIKQAIAYLESLG